MVASTIPTCCPSIRYCDCDFTKCPGEIECGTNQKRLLVSKGLRRPGRCCDVFACVQMEDNCTAVKCPQLQPYSCPRDSYSLPVLITHGECCPLFQGCDCLPCLEEEPVCDDEEKVRLVEKGTREPGRCCDKYKCEKETSYSCEWDGKVYAEGESWLTECFHCHCARDGSICLQSPECVIPECDKWTVPEGECCPICVDCISESGKAHNNSDVWREDDCVTCRCDEGTVSCQAELCRQLECSTLRKLPSQCCPVCADEDESALPPSSTEKPSVECAPLRNCTLVCPSGHALDSRGCLQCACRKATPQCPPLEHCDRMCPYGRQLDGDGCRLCLCSRCPPFVDCVKNCTFGFELNDVGCHICKCKDQNALVPPDERAPPSPSQRDGIPCSSSNGAAHADGESWYDGCRQCSCQNGREMCALISCPPLVCEKPVLVESTCCPYCADDPSPPQESKALLTVCHSVNGRYYTEGETWRMDKCTHCTCLQGVVLCDVEQCPATPCAHPARSDQRCCPYCPTVNVGLLPLPDTTRSTCVDDAGLLHHHGDRWKPDPCESCICANGRLKCFRDKCRGYAVPDECPNLVLKKGQCCPQCLKGTPSKICRYEGSIYSSGEHWIVDQCTTCFCFEGNPMCTQKVCQPLNCPRTTHTPGQCCPVCNDSTSSGDRQGPFNQVDVALNKDDAGEAKSRSSQETTAILAVLAALVCLLVIVITVLLIYILRKHGHAATPSSTPMTMTSGGLPAMAMSKSSSPSSGKHARPASLDLRSGAMYDYDTIARQNTSNAHLEMNLPVDSAGSSEDNMTDSVSVKGHVNNLNV